MTEEAWVEAVLRVWRRGQQLSAVGPGDVRIHLDHARELAARIDKDAGRGLDLGTGAGIPGLALAGYRAEMSWTLVDAAQRRTRLLSAAVDELGWQDRVSVVHERAELLPHHAGMAGSFGVVVARLFGPPAVAAECAAPLARRGGQVLVTEPPDVAAAGAQEARWNEAGLAVLGLVLGQRWADPMAQELRRVGDPESRFPRKPGVAAKRPLW